MRATAAETYSLVTPRSIRKSLISSRRCSSAPESRRRESFILLLARRAYPRAKTSAPTFRESYKVPVL